VTLTRLVLAWLPVAAEFLIVSGFQQPAAPPAPTGARWALTRREALWRSLEAAAVTLVASLWFDSLGHGGWWLLFLLVGLLVTLARLPDPYDRGGVTRVVRDAARYVLAGAILAWRLG
jgi:hypothetical protein